MADNAWLWTTSGASGRQQNFKNSVAIFGFSRKAGLVADRSLYVGPVKLVHGERVGPTPPPPIAEPFEDCLVFTVTEAAELLGVSRAFAYELAARGELPVLRLGRRVVVPKVALLALVASAVGDRETDSASL